MDIRHIIREEIDRVILEKKGKKSEKKGDSKESKKSPKKSDKPKKDSGVRKNALKVRNGRRKSFDYKKYNKENPNSNYSDNTQLSKYLKNPAINVSAIAQMVYPDHTKEGAQSQLRKKIEGEISDSGTKYSFRNKEIHKVNRALNLLGLK